MQPVNINSITTKQILVQTDEYKMICFVFEPGKGLPDHTHNGLASIQVVSGLVDMNFVDGSEYTLNPGDVLGFDARIQHNVIAKETSKIIVTIIF